MFVVDDLVSWLTGRLADAGYQKLATLLRGSDQARALKQAVTAAVQATVGEIGPSDGEEAERAADQISNAFGRRDPVPLPPGQPTLLEALQAGIAGQLSVLDEAGQPGVSLPRMPVSEVAARLIGHLVRQIQIRGSRGGPLADLADQLNHDLTHLQGQRLEGMLAQVLDWLGDPPAPRGGAAGPVGWPLAEVRDPFALEVHRAVEPDIPQPGLPVLPVYVPREHDAALGELVTAAAAGTSAMAVLVGGSSTGKTRACWQTLEPLRGLEPGWRLWHPVDAQAALAHLPGLGPRTVVWLNEAQRYLSLSDGTGERVAAGLRELLGDRVRGPVLVLATLWPEFWAELTARPLLGADPHAQARELLAGRNIRVRSDFTDEELRELAVAGDPRLAQAAVGSRDRQVIQYLAGAPDLLDRYDNAPPAARALIHAAMDARRLGMRADLSRAFLETAAPGYLTDTNWDLLTEGWLQQALSYTAKPCKGVRGPLTRIRPRPGDSAALGTDCRLADYLDQRGRQDRRRHIPPAGFWAAAARFAHPADLPALASAAEARGLLRDAARLRKQATAHGDTSEAAILVRHWHSLHPRTADPNPAQWAADHASLDNPGAVARLLNALDQAGADDQAAALLARDPAAHVALDDPGAVADLLKALGQAGREDEADVLAGRAAAYAPLDDPGAVADLLNALDHADREDEADVLAARAAAHAALDDPYAVADLLNALDQGSREGEADVLAGRAAAHAALDDPGAVADLLRGLRWADADDQAAALLALDPAAQADLSDPLAGAALLRAVRWAGGDDRAAALAARAAAHAALDNPYAVAELLRGLRRAGAGDQAAALLARDPAAHVALVHPGSLADLRDALREAGAGDQAAALAARAASDAASGAVADALRVLWRAGASDRAAALLARDPAHVALDDPRAVAELLRGLRRAGAGDQAAALLARDPAAHVALDHLHSVADLVDALRWAGGEDQARVLAARAAAHVALDDPYAVAELLRGLRRAGADDQAAALLARDPAAHVALDHLHSVAELLRALREAGANDQAGMLADRLPADGKFDLFRVQPEHEMRYKFGREPDGSPAPSWDWDDLD